jgi:hypothetical protein
LVHNANVPFTLAHGAAAIPFRRVGLLTSGLLVGTFAPDFEYFLRLAPDNGFGHTLLGTFVLTLPLALLVLWLFHAFVKMPVARLLPGAIQRRLTNHLGKFRFGGMARFALVAGSILVGIATHVAWDSFTHRNTWLCHHWPPLGQTVNLPILGLIPFYKVFQHGSTVMGTAILSIWLAVRYRNAEPSDRVLVSSVSRKLKMVISAVVATVALGGAAIRAVVGIGVPTDHSSGKRFVGLLVATAIALVWWQLVAYGVFASRHVPLARGPEL